MTYNRAMIHWRDLWKYRVMSYEPMKHKKSYIQNTPAKMKDNTNILTGCIKKVKSQKYWTQRKIKSESSLSYCKNQWQNTSKTNEQELSYSWLGTGIFKCRKWWIKPCFIALNLSLCTTVSLNSVIFTMMRELNRLNK